MADWSTAAWALYKGNELLPGEEEAYRSNSKFRRLVDDEVLRLKMGGSSYEGEYAGTNENINNLEKKLSKLNLNHSWKAGEMVRQFRINTIDEKKCRLEVRQYSEHIFLTAGQAGYHERIFDQEVPCSKLDIDYFKKHLSEYDYPENELKKLKK